MKSVNICIIILVFKVIAFFALSGCSDLRNPLKGGSTSGCEASKCHEATLIGEFPPESGKHNQHLNSVKHGIKCSVCHSNYNDHQLHKDGVINGYNLLTSSQADGDIINFGNYNSGAGWDNSNGTCNNMQCHIDKSSLDWYGTGYNTECISCHGTSGSHGTAETHVIHTTVNNRGPVILLGCDDCHDTDNYPDFVDGKDLINTNICDNCHSPDGGYNGVSDSNIGAKNNWDSGVYNGNVLKNTKKRWCAGCHDNAPANSMIDGTGVDAPGIAGNGTTYGYYINGHKSKDCSDCHDLALPHIDGIQPSFSVEWPLNGYGNLDEVEAYNNGYRLKQIDSGWALEVPRGGSYDADDFRLCYSCHTEINIAGVPDGYAYQLGWEPPEYLKRSDVPVAQTNFRNEQSWGLGWTWTDPPAPTNSHWTHLYGYISYDADYSGLNESLCSCITCHNPHGTKDAGGHPTLRMTRGDLDMSSGIYIADEEGDPGYPGTYPYGYIGCDEYRSTDKDLHCGACHQFALPDYPDPDDPGYNSYDSTRYYREVLDIPMPQ